MYNGKVVVINSLTDKSFEVEHMELDEVMIVKNIPDDEDILKWVSMPSHTNIVTAYDNFEYDGK